MMDLKRLKRLHQQKIDEQKQSMASSIKRVNQLESEKSMMEQSVKDEKRAADASLEGAFSYAHYIEGMRERLDKIDRFLKEAYQKLEEEREKLRLLYADLKTLEITEAKHLALEKKKRETREQNELDDFYGARSSLSLAKSSD